MYNVNSPAVWWRVVPRVPASFFFKFLCTSVRRLKKEEEKKKEKKKEQNEKEVERNLVVAFNTLFYQFTFQHKSDNRRIGCSGWLRGCSYLALIDAIFR